MSHVKCHLDSFLTRQSFGASLWTLCHQPATPLLGIYACKTFYKLTNIYFSNTFLLTFCSKTSLEYVVNLSTDQNSSVVDCTSCFIDRCALKLTKLNISFLRKCQYNQLYQNLKYCASEQKQSKGMPLNH